MARHLAARARFDLRPRERFSRKVSERESLEAAMLQGNNVYKVMKQWLMMVTTCPSLEGRVHH